MGQPRISRILLILVPALLLASGLMLVGLYISLQSRPSWVLTARNTTAGLVVEVCKSDAMKPTYVVTLQGRSLSREFSRLGRAELDPALGTTMFFDETLKPGRWTLMLTGTRLDIMEARLIVNNRTELAPGQSALITVVAVADAPQVES